MSGACLIIARPSEHSTRQPPVTTRVGLSEVRASDRWMTSNTQGSWYSVSFVNHYED